MPLMFGLELAAHVVKQEQRAVAAAGGAELPVPPRPLSTTPGDEILNHALDIRRSLAKKLTPSAGE